MSSSINKGQIIKIALAAIVFLVLWFIPTAAIGLPNISIVEHRVIAIFALALILWFTEAIPSWTTSMLIVVIMLLTCTDSSFSFLREGENLGKLLSHKAVMAAFADPTIMLFMGGFVIAIIASKMGIDVQLARVLLLPFGKRSEFVLLGFILVTGIFSMFISNTATAAMMLTFMAPVLRQLPADDKGRIGLVMAIPIGANIGGMATPVGTPPNAIALKYLNDPAGLGFNIGFGDWAMVMMPFTILLLILAWLLLIKLFPFKDKEISLNIEGETAKGPRLVIAYITLGLTILLWLLDKVTGINANTVAMIPIAIFCVTGLFGKDDLKEINWDVLWLVAGGFALGIALQNSGLAKNLVEAIPFAQWSPLVVIIGAGLLCWFFSNIISNTATAALLIPIMVAVGTGMGDVLTPFGGILTLILGVTLSASLAMILPVSTPPNAIAYSTGLVDVKYMRTVGIIVGVVGLALAFTMLVIVGKAGIML
jgi:sodium-dependent dicarboxylate transporter 2/3/5